MKAGSVLLIAYRLYQLSPHFTVAEFQKVPSAPLAIVKYPATLNFFSFAFERAFIIADRFTG